MAKNTQVAKQAKKPEIKWPEQVPLIEANDLVQNRLKAWAVWGKVGEVFSIKFNGQKLTPDEEATRCQIIAAMAAVLCETGHKLVIEMPITQYITAASYEQVADLWNLTMQKLGYTEIHEVPV